ncbi:MAG TPA: TIGR04283 family arsenosugar biosynthesis glycosyltransferase, partial [Casimicrobiaceae bacterium]|nr:TIGR04283 family arsenosugar biosynthesis glycosyltransferase [Casimicrobiaceae bacterium]
MRLAIIVPARNEAAVIGATLTSLQPLRARGHEVIVVDGGSDDATRAVAAPLADIVRVAHRGRASQMNAGAAAASAFALLFLHADTRLPERADMAVAQALAKGARWGRFDVAIDGRSVWLPLVARAMNLRSRLTGIATGDQAMFVLRDDFTTVGGFPALPLMEDVALSALLKRAAGPPACLRDVVVTSGRRWDAQGALRTIA